PAAPPRRRPTPRTGRAAATRAWAARPSATAAGSTAAGAAGRKRSPAPGPGPRSLEPQPLQPDVEDPAVAQDLHALAVRGQAAGDDPEQVGERGPDGHGRLLVAVPPGEAGGPGLDQPLGGHAGE